MPRDETNDEALDSRTLTPDLVRARDAPRAYAALCQFGR